MLGYFSSRGVSSPTVNSCSPRNKIEALDCQTWSLRFTAYVCQSANETPIDCTGKTITLNSIFCLECIGYVVIMTCWVFESLQPLEIQDNNVNQMIIMPTKREWSTFPVIFSWNTRAECRVDNLLHLHWMSSTFSWSCESWIKLHWLVALEEIIVESSIVSGTWSDVTRKKTTFTLHTHTPDFDCSTFIPGTQEVSHSLYVLKSVTVPKVRYPSSAPFLPLTFPPPLFLWPPPAWPEDFGSSYSKFRVRMSI